MSQANPTSSAPLRATGADRAPRGRRLLRYFRTRLRRYADRPMVRPLALAGPILVLVFALPLLRPLRHPSEMSNDENLRLATVRALVEHHSLSLEHNYAHFRGAVKTRSGVYSSQPPMMALLLSAPAWVM